MLPEFKLEEIWNSRLLRHQLKPKEDDERNPFSAFNHAIGFRIAFAEQGFAKFNQNKTP